MDIIAIRYDMRIEIENMEDNYFYNFTVMVNLFGKINQIYMTE